MINSPHYTSKAIKAYYIALQHLKDTDQRISFDAVALAAGRGRGAIKGSTSEIIKLKKDILEAKKSQNEKHKQKCPQQKLSESNRIKEDYKAKYEKVSKINAVLIDQLASTVFELEELKLELKRILKAQNNIINIR
ncbi:hypothetical protein [Acinetobacter terrae]|uniref:Uncharacterized protein n=1 Tax=Acinetobacter terrae TaxID=2731247 RepID=A0A8E4FFJ3_9GAMM|nr:hypothetical protein [Acinetobacter terrae]NNH39584.1 hypothetical protein [Acinetobacter terrae]